MKGIKFIIYIVVLLLSKSMSAQVEKISMSVKVFYIVRHGEKDTGSNPVLSKAGNARAGDLYRALRDKHIALIYVSQFRRTKLTGDSLHNYGHIDFVTYKMDETGDDLVNTIKLQSVKQDTILIIGHSNTIPGIIRKLGVTDYNLKEIPDNEYDNLFEITIEGDKASLKKIKYGKLSPPLDGNPSMKPLQ